MKFSNSSIRDILEEDSTCLPLYERRCDVLIDNYLEALMLEEKEGVDLTTTPKVGTEKEAKMPIAQASDITQDKFKMEILDVNRFVKENHCKEITNPIFFNRYGAPTDDGLLSNAIFGITTDTRSSIFAYISLGKKFLHPLLYRLWNKLDSKIPSIINSTKRYKIIGGKFVEDDKGETGVAFLQKAIKKIKFEESESYKRNIMVKMMNLYKDKPSAFVDKWLVIPAYYRDVDSSDGSMGVGEVNQLYNRLMLSVKSLTSTADMGLNLSDAVEGSIQSRLVATYMWFLEEPKLTHKMGMIERSLMSKSADYGARVIITNPNTNRADSIKDVKVDMDHACLSLAACMTNFFPFVLYNLKNVVGRIFGNNTSVLPFIDKKNSQVTPVHIKNPLILFSEDRLKKEMDKFIHGFASRLEPVYLETEDGKKIIAHAEMIVRRPTRDGLDTNKQAVTNNEDKKTQDPYINRPLTWCDLFFIATSIAVEGKHILVTRYPIDSYFNQFPLRVNVGSTLDTMHAWTPFGQYRLYPKIHKDDIGKNTSNMFMDTLNISNTYLDSIGGDYDGDQVSTKGVYSDEANVECEYEMQSNRHYITLGASFIIGSSKETMYTQYMLTRKLEDGVTLGMPEF